MSTATVENIQIIRVRSEEKKARLAAKMTYQQMIELSGLTERVIRDFEAGRFNKNNHHIAKRHQEAIDKYLFDHHTAKAKITISESEELRKATLDMIHQKLESSNLEQLLRIARKLGVDID